jgi:hypothetical protein
MDWRGRSASSLLALALAAGMAGCGSERVKPPGTGGEPDMSKPPIIFDEPDLSGEPDMATEDPNVINDCGDTDKNCQSVKMGPPDTQFPLTGDPMKDPLLRDNGVNRDVNGWLRLDSTHTAFNFVWIANSGHNTVSKIDSKTVREVARYPSATCMSLKTGSTAACDGTNGCCSIDDWNRYQARKAKMPQPPHQAVQLTQNYPSRTTVDFNGDLFVSNRAFGGQSAVTKVANDPANCIDRNKNGRIDTSADVNGDGMIDKDCNGDGADDDLAGVRMKPCNNNLKQEYFGKDDECVIWTSNTFTSNQLGRPLGLAASDGGNSYAWAGGYNNGIFVKVNGTTGLQEDHAQLPQGCNPYGLAVDANGIGWATNLGAGLCYFDTKKTMNVGKTSTTKGSGYGITLDRDQNIWIGSQVTRYTPDRTNGFNNLGNGWWTTLQNNVSGVGIAADSRGPNDYYVWSCNSGSVTQIKADAKAIPKNNKADQSVMVMTQVIQGISCHGVGVDSDQNIWGIGNDGVATRALVDKNGMITQPQRLNPMGNNKCPAGDKCEIRQDSYTYSDFTGFGLRNFTRPQGSYSYIVSGCKDETQSPIDTQWWNVIWDAEVPPNTSLTVRTRASAGADQNSAYWGNAQWSNDYPVSPADLQQGLPNNQHPGLDEVVNNPYLNIEFTFKTSASNASPKLKSFTVSYKCKAGIG